MRFLQLALLALALAVSVPAQAQTDDDDVGFLTRLLQDSLSDAGRDVQIRGFQGALSSRATIASMVISDDDGAWLILENVALQWNRRALLARRIEIQEISAERLQVLRPPQTEAAPPAPEARSEPFSFSLPELPVSIRMDQLRLDRVELGAAFLGDEVAFRVQGAAQLAGGDGQTQLDITRIDDGPEGVFALEAAFSNQTRVLALDLELREGPAGIAVSLLDIPDRPSAALRIAGEGALDDFRAEIALATDAVDRVQGHVRVNLDAGGDASAFEAALTGDLRPLLNTDFHPFFGDQSVLRAAGARSPDGRLSLDELTVRTNKLQLSGQARIGPDNLPEFLDLTGQIAADDGGRVRLPVGGDPTTIDRADLSLAFDADEDEDWSLLVTLERLERPDIAIAAVTLDGIGRITADAGGAGVASVDAVLDFAATGLAPTDPDLAQALGTAVSGNLALIWRDDAPLRLPGLVIEGEDFFLNGRAVLDAGKLEFAMDTEASQLSRFSGLAGRALSGALGGRVTGEVIPRTGGFDLEAEINGRDLRIDQEQVDNLLTGNSRIALSARRDETGVILRGLRAEARTLSADLTGAIRSDMTRLQGQLDFTDLGVLGNGFGGAMRADMTLEAGDGADRLTLTATAQDLTVGQADADRALRGTAQLELAASRTGDTITIDHLRVENPVVQLDASGRYDPDDILITTAFVARQLDAIRPGLGGGLRGQATIDGTLDDTRLALRAAAQDLTIGQADADRALRGTTELDTVVRRAGDVIAIERLALSNPLLQLDASGRHAPDDLALAAEFAITGLDRLRPGFGGSLSGTLDVSGDATAQRASIDATATNLRFGAPQADALFAGATQISAAISAQDGVVTPESVRVSNAQLNATILGSATSAGRNLQIEARLNDLARVVEGISGPVQVGGQVVESDAGFDMNLSGTGPAGIDLVLSGRLSPDLRADLRVTGSAELAIANPRIEPNSVQGPLDLDIRVQGPLALESVSGTVQLRDGSFFLPATGVRLIDIAGNVQLTGGRAQLALQGASSQGGGFTAEGSIELLGARQTDLTVTLSEFGIRDPQLFETSISGQARLSGPQATGPRFSGRLVLDRTEIRIPSTALGSAGFVPPTLRHINESEGSRTTRTYAGILAREVTQRPQTPITLDLTLEAPNRVFIRGRGLDAELGGSVRLTGTNLDVVPIGQFSLVRGRLDLLGNRFTLSEGQASLQGQLVPFIRLVATTVSRGVSTSIVLQGEATSPEIQFTSVPELPEEEVVSRLIFDRDLLSLTPFQAAQLASAIATLSGRGGNGVMDRLRTGFGLDDLDVVTDDSGQAALRAGRYLTENIYTDVLVDSEGKTEVTINLDLTSSVTVRGRADTEGRSSVGVFFERDY